MEFEEEDWQRFYIKGIKTRYLISSYGRVFDTKQKLFVRTHLDPKGYYKCSIIVTKKTYLHMFVHRMVALTYVYNPKPDLYDTVDHIDGVKTNNHWNNLRWCTKGMNSKYAIEMGLIDLNKFGDESPNHVYNGKQVDKAISMMNGEYTYSDIAEATGIDIGSVIAIKRKESWVEKTKDKELTVKLKSNVISEEDLNRAIELLKTGDYTLKEISLLCHMNKRTVAAIIDKKIHKDLTKGLNLSVKYTKKNTELQDVIKVVDMLDGNHTYNDIVRETGVSKSTIYKILNHMRWKDITNGKLLKIKK